MNHLLYSSNEMYSSTELIRKSKTIFNKILSEEIDKAIILRDGKPSFMLLDFDKYEKIMAEYDILKAKDLSNKDTKINTKKVKKNKKDKASKNRKKQDIEIQKTKIIEQVKLPKNLEKKIVEAEEIEIIEEKKSIKSAHIVPPAPSFKEEDEIFEDELKIEPIVEVDEEEVLKEKTEDAVQQGLEVLKDLDFDDDFKKEVEEKVRARKSREIMAQNIEEKKIQEVIEPKVVQKKKPQLKEFWA